MADDLSAKQALTAALVLMATGQREVTITPADVAKLDNLFTYATTADPTTGALTVKLTEKPRAGQKQLPLSGPKPKRQKGKAG